MIFHIAGVVVTTKIPIWNIIQNQHNREDNKSETEKILDRLTEITLAQQKVDDRSDTQKALDKLTDQAVEPIIVDSMAELEAESVTITKENNNILS